MPRKQNGWGSPKNTSFKNFDSNPKPKGAAGSYPSFRKYGSTVTRTAIEQWDLDSTWARWRKGMEYYYQAAWLPLLTENPNFDYSLPDQRDPDKPNYNPKFITQTLSTVLYQGTDSEVPVTFEGYRFATKNADSKTHYVLKRTITANIDLGTVVSVYGDRKAHKEQFQRGEVWVDVTTPSASADYSLVRSIGERITDGIVSANISNVLTEEGRPAIYLGKSQRDDCRAQVRIPLVGPDGIESISLVQNGSINDLTGNVVYISAFYQQTLIDGDDEFNDFRDYVEVKSTKINTDVKVSILALDANALPPSLYDIQTLTPIYTTKEGDTKVTSTHYLQKSDYQKYYANQYLTAGLVQSEVESLAYTIMPFIILGVAEDKANNQLVIDSEPFQSTIQLFTPTSDKRFVVCSPKSFSKEYIDNNADGEYNHAPPIPGEQLWKKLSLDVNPWMDETFVQGSVLQYGQVYSCSCPAYLHAKIRQPEVMDEEGNLINRQARAPLPSAKGADFFDGGGITKVAGIISSWADEAYKRDFKLCKHTIAAMFLNKIRVEEPNTLPSYETRLKFEEKLTEDIDEVAQEFGEMLRRSEVTTIELIFSLAEALNMDDVELGYLMQNANF